ncbi:aldolase catalytic domain-containing protein [Thorsellia kenyensis]|uniref:Homocitrate synthase n=1 Tax=Thorsellia kenyensis TaxID=1549888 RepID=A0ABV6C9G0_9GAMM
MIKVLDCTLRDGGYYNSWDFPAEVVNEYLIAMELCGVDVVELGFRSSINNGFKGPNAFTTEAYLSSLIIPESLKIAVMINASELINGSTQIEIIEKLMPLQKDKSRVDIVRLACHMDEFYLIFPVIEKLKELGYEVIINIMQIAESSYINIEKLAKAAKECDFNVLYFADSMGSLNPSDVQKIIKSLRKYWENEIGIHTHDNKGLALSNTLVAIQNKVHWVDSTVTGMGRGPGNAKTEELMIEISDIRDKPINILPLMKLINSFFVPLKTRCLWGTNPYYYLSGKYGIHPTYVQEMLSDSRYTDEDIISALKYLKNSGGKKFNIKNLDSSRILNSTEDIGNWEPKTILNKRDVLLLGTGPGVKKHKLALERFIKEKDLVVIALNAQSELPQDFIKYRIACHPIRILADINEYAKLPQELITHKKLFDEYQLEQLGVNKILDYAIQVIPGEFDFNSCSCVIPNSLVFSYALAVITAGCAKQIYMAGFDGYGADDPRNSEMNKIIKLYKEKPESLELISVTPTRYQIPVKSIYGLF